jgi:hypothetical protein
VMVLAIDFLLDFCACVLPIISLVLIVWKIHELKWTLNACLGSFCKITTTNCSWFVQLIRTKINKIFWCFFIQF